MSDVTLADRIEREIEEMFQRVARDIRDGTLETGHLKADAAGGMPATLFDAERHMVKAWREYVRLDEAKRAGRTALRAKVVARGDGEVA